MQRRLTAIVAADVVDYSIHLGRNEVATLSALNRLHLEIFAPAVQKYNGRIIRFTGDGSILLFESALDAINFAINVQHRIKERRDQGQEDIPLEFRMGANLCDIIQQGDDIHGEGVNVAVRLEELAPPGGLCLSHGIYLQAKSAIAQNLLPIGERQLKNIADPVFVWRWHPNGEVGHIDRTQATQPRKPHFRGRQILDPQVTSLLIDLHMRSARLGVSDAFDAILNEPNEGRGLGMGDLYRHIGFQLNAARGMLNPIFIECADDVTDPLGVAWQSPLSMAEFISNVFDSAKTAYAFKLLPEIQRILESEEPPFVRRAMMMRLTEGFMQDEMGPRAKSLVKFAFVETV